MQVRESNSHLISSYLRRSGVPVRQIMVIENNLDVLVLMLRRLSAVHRYIFLTGGIGPRHTDISMLAVAKAFGTGVQEHPALLTRILASSTSKSFSQYHWRMAYIPFGAELLTRSPQEEDALLDSFAQVFLLLYYRHLTTLYYRHFTTDTYTSLHCTTYTSLLKGRLITRLLGAGAIEGLEPNRSITPRFLRSASGD